MHSRRARNTWILLRHEFARRIRTRSFLLTTFLMPLLMAGLVGVPIAAGKQVNRHSQNIVVVTPDSDLAPLLRESFAQSGQGKFNLTIDDGADPQSRSRLADALRAQRIDGYIWLEADAVETGTATLTRRSSGDLTGQISLRAAIRLALSRSRLEKAGMPPAEASRLLQDIHLESTVLDEAGGQKQGNLAPLVTVLGLVAILFISLFSYGVSVMRSVLDEKASRVLEVLLCSATPEELIAGKILGIGAVGFIQVSMWMAIGLCIALPNSRAAVPIPAYYLAYFVVFFLLGFLLYSAVFAALGAAFDSTEEAQNWVFITVSPLIIATSMIASVATAPNSTLATVASMIPFSSPVLMYLRIVVETPRAWQIALSMLILAGTAWATARIATRVYRVGILTHGKRPTLGRLLRSLRYA